VQSFLHFGTHNVKYSMYHPPVNDEAGAHPHT